MQLVRQNNKCVLHLTWTKMYCRWVFLFYKGFHAKISNGAHKIKGHIINHLQKLFTFQISEIHFPFSYIFISTVWIISFETLVALLYWLKWANNSSEIAFLSLCLSVFYISYAYRSYIWCISILLRVPIKDSEYIWYHFKELHEFIELFTCPNSFCISYFLGAFPRMTVCAHRDFACINISLWHLLCEEIALYLYAFPPPLLSSFAYLQTLSTGVLLYILKDTSKSSPFVHGLQFSPASS